VEEKCEDGLNFLLRISTTVAKIRRECRREVNRFSRPILVRSVSYGTTLSSAVSNSMSCGFYLGDLPAFECSGRQADAETAGHRGIGIHPSVLLRDLSDSALKINNKVNAVILSRIGTSC